MDADALTAALAGRLAAIVPAGFRVQARDGMLWYPDAPVLACAPIPLVVDPTVSARGGPGRGRRGR